MISYDESTAIVELDLDPIKVKLMHQQSGEGWTITRANSVEIEYRRFLYLSKAFPNEPVAPSEDVDTFWHYHILDTMKYAEDCQQIFGYFLHHFPYLGMRGEDDLRMLQQIGASTRALHRQNFGDEDHESSLDVGAVAAFCVKTAATDATSTAFCVKTVNQAKAAAFCVKPANEAGNTAFCVKPGSQARSAAFCVKPSLTAAGSTAFCVKPSATARSTAFCVVPSVTKAAPTAFCVKPSVDRAAPIALGSSAENCFIRKLTGGSAIFENGADLFTARPGLPTEVPA